MINWNYRSQIQPYRPQGETTLPAYEQFGKALQEAILKQQQEEQFKAQLMQSFGFAPNMAAFGAIPHGAAVRIQDGQALIRPGGIDNVTQTLLNALLGLRQSAKTAGIQDPRAVGQPGGAIPDYTDFKQRETGLVPYNDPNQPAADPNAGFVENALLTAKANNDQALLAFLIRNYPELMPKDFGTQQNTGLMFGNAPQQPISRFTIPMYGRR